MAAVIELPTSTRVHSAAMSGNALVLDGVTRQFGALRAIDDITFTVAAGERRAIWVQTARARSSRSTTTST